MRKFLQTVAALCLLLSPATLSAQRLVLKQQSLPNPDNEPVPVHPVPHQRQLLWQETEFYAFFHYGMNTYTGLEWGNGDEAETIFAPTAPPNPMQWLRACKAAGMRGGIAVVKHHDGFCLWPTETTTHNVTRSGNLYGQQTNIPRDFAAAARKLGMKYGFYVSPWDRNNASYGTDTYVHDVFLRQCAELTQYGADQFEMWFDGANGGTGYYGGSGGTRAIDRDTYYDVPNLRDSVHKVCPSCVLWGVGGEARWIGNEEGWAGQTNWSPENRGQAPESNGMYGAANGWFWLPGESDAKATNRGWFYHDGEEPLTPERLFQMYLETVGRNATLILNCPPGKDGLLPEATVQSLKGMGNLIKSRLGKDLARRARVEASAIRMAGKHRSYAPTCLTDGKPGTYWATDDGVKTATVTLTWKKPVTVRYVQLMEYIRKGQRIKAFNIEITTDGITWQPCAQGQETTTIGYKRIVPLNGKTADSYGEGYIVRGLRVNITASRACPLLSNLSVF